MRGWGEGSRVDQYLMLYFFACLRSISSTWPSKPPLPFFAPPPASRRCRPCRFLSSSSTCLFSSAPLLLQLLEVLLLLLRRQLLQLVGQLLLLQVLQLHLALLDAVEQAVRRRLPVLRLVGDARRRRLRRQLAATRRSSSCPSACCSAVAVDQHRLRSARVLISASSLSNGVDDDLARRRPGRWPRSCPRT